MLVSTYHSSASSLQIQILTIPLDRRDRHRCGRRIFAPGLKSYYFTTIIQWTGNRTIQWTGKKVLSSVSRYYHAIHNKWCGVLPAVDISLISPRPTRERECVCALTRHRCEQAPIISSSLSHRNFSCFSPSGWPALTSSSRGPEAFPFYPLAVQKRLHDDAPD